MLRNRKFSDEGERRLLDYARPRIRSSITGTNEIAAKKLAAQYGIGTLEEIVEDPGPFAYVWGWFIDLHSRRQFDGAAGMSQPIAWRDIKAWSDVTQTPLATHEIRLLTTLDDFFLSEERKAKKSEADRQMQKNKSKARSR